MTVFKDSIHMGSMSPSRMIHLGPSCVMLARSRIAVENRPAPQRHSGSSPHSHLLEDTWDCCSHETHSFPLPLQERAPGKSSHAISHPMNRAHSSRVSPSFHSRVAGWMIPNSSSQVTALGSRSTVTGLLFSIWYVLLSDLSTCGEHGAATGVIPQGNHSFCCSGGHRVLGWSPCPPSAQGTVEAQPCHPALSCTLPAPQHAQHQS